MYAYTRFIWRVYNLSIRFGTTLPAGFPLADDAQTGGGGGGGGAAGGTVQAVPNTFGENLGLEGTM